ncbi:hypothetical protein [Elizabethkingia anophelis]|uniref:hypothetical protein n=1 Tax=Elizabethkingia anophelis TaxID=1117645 RepID=UPI00259B92B1|nr:hypothetical protein [Elizabethkingia anophelis]WJK00025.1 hypothetical protein QTN78_18240 [Elizabethkingia anophelis]
MALKSLLLFCISIISLSCIKQKANQYEIDCNYETKLAKNDFKYHFNDYTNFMGKLTYYLYSSIDKLDTTSSRRTIIKDKKIDLSKIQSLEINRIDNIPCKDRMMDSCDPYFTAAYYLYKK